MMSKLKFLLSFLLLSSCSSLSDLTESFTNFLGDEEILFLSAYENVKIVDQDSNLTGQNSHPINISEERVESSFRGSNTSVFRTSGHKNQLFTSEGLRRETSSNGDANSQACAEEQYVAHAPLSCRGHVHSNYIAVTNEQGVINGANSAISFTIIEPNDQKYILIRSFVMTMTDFASQ